LVENTGGVLSYWNLKEFACSKSPKSISEYPLFTDAHVTGELKEGFEPYYFINMIATSHNPGDVRESIILRIGWHVKDNRTFGVKTETSKYHGGGLTDEIAALVSLKLGIRLKAGDETRIFGGYSDDPLGTPRASVTQPPKLMPRNKQLILPSVFKTVNLSELAELKSLENVQEKQYVALIRAARLYQDALWVVESEPALAWIMLISAIEVAANQQSLEDATPEKKLEELKPELAKLLIENGGNKLLSEVAMEITSSLGATNKFIKFCLLFMPEPPMERPPEWAQISWSKKSLKKILNKLYGYRSDALHGGTPFPEPMCRPPEKISKEHGFTEKGSMGLATHTLGGSWKSDDIPININIFNYMVNGILNNWCKSLTNIS